MPRSAPRGRGETAGSRACPAMRGPAPAVAEETSERRRSPCSQRRSASAPPRTGGATASISRLVNTAAAAAAVVAAAVAAVTAAVAAAAVAAADSGHFPYSVRGQPPRTLSPSAPSSLHSPLRPSYSSADSRPAPRKAPPGAG